jgi:hypothetical protein
MTAWVCEAGLPQVFADELKQFFERRQRRGVAGAA